MPPAAELPDRLHAVLAVIYLIFTEGHTATVRRRARPHRPVGRGDPARPACSCELMPDEPEVVGLLALMLLTDARRPARLAPDGALVRLRRPGPLPVGPRRSSPRATTLVRACLRRNQPGPFQIQAAIAAVHADAPTAAATDWAPDRRRCTTSSSRRRPTPWWR